MTGMHRLRPYTCEHSVSQVLIALEHISIDFCQEPNGCCSTMALSHLDDAAK
jgi:hypothetical protein